MVITGTTGDDVIHGTSSADTIDGLNGNDQLYGGAGNDSITSGPGTDYLYGEDGDDTLISKRGTGPDYFDGGAGIDKVNVDLAKSIKPLSVDLTNPNILQYFGDGGSIVNVEQITIVGGTGADRFTGGALADSLNGYDGDDILKGAGGNDTIIGGNGYDIAAYTGPASAYTVTLQTDGSYKVSSAAEGTDTLTTVETLRFSDGDRPIGGYTSSATYWGSANGSSSFVAGINVPDGLGAIPGTGFTITGLTRAADGTWWAANEGQANDTDSSYTPSLVHLAADLTTKLGEISIGTKTLRSIQGVISHDNNLYVASLSEGLVRVFNANTGALIQTITPTAGNSVNGIAYDTVLNAVIIGHADNTPLVKQVEWRDATTGALIKTLDLSNAPDHLYFDSTSGPQGALWYTYGDNGVGVIGHVVKVDIATGQEIGRYDLAGADAIEGIVVDGNQLFIANDAYYHYGGPPLNRILQYNITPEAIVLDKHTSSTALSINLGTYDQTLADGTHLVGAERLFFSGGSGADVVTGGIYDDVLAGGDGADTLSGGGGNDRLVGAAGNDILQGGAGNDGLEGAGGNDTAIFSGSRASYSITQLSSDGLQLTDLRDGSPDGTDTANSIESFIFSDGTFSFAQLFQTNAAPTAVTLSNALVSLAENSNVAGGIKVADIAITDDGLGTNTLSLSGADAASFAIRATSGGGRALYYIGSSPDYEAKSSYSVTVNAQDLSIAGSSPVHRDFTLAVTDVNEAPTAMALSNTLSSLAENSNVTGGVKVADIAITDDALGSNTLSLSGADAASFAIRDTSGGGHALYYIGSSPNYETQNSYAVTVTAQDLSVVGSAPVQQDFALAITDVNEAPTAVALLNTQPSLAAHSDVTGGVKIADIAVTDDALGTNTLSLSGADAASFAIRGESGGGQALYYIGSSPNYQTKSSYAVTVNAQDTTIAGSAPVHQDFTLGITNVNAAPIAVTLSNNLASLTEGSNVTGGIKVADITLVDDGIGTNTLSLSGADASSFAIRDTSDGGQALYYIGNSPNYDVKNSYAVTVNAQDATVAGSAPVHQDFTLAIADVNAAPTAVTLSNTMTSLADNSDVTGGIRVADIAITDDMLGANTLSLSGADAASFEIRNTSGGGQALYYIGSSPDYEAKSSYAVTVNAQDATVAGSAPVHQDFTLAIADVNEAPTAVTLSNTLASLAENSDVTGGIRVADIAITDDALGANTLSLSGADASSFEVRNTTGGGRALYFVGNSPDFEAKNSYAVTVNAQDATVAGSTPVHQDFTLGVVNMNAAPTAVTLSNTLTSLAENSDVTGGIKVADIAITDDGLGANTLGLSGADAALFAIHDTSDGGHALYYIGNSPDYETQSSYSVTVKVQDLSIDGSTPAYKDFTLAITDVNESPVNQAPTAVTLSNTLPSLAENSNVTGGIKVADITVTDDATGTNTMSLSGADASSFEIRNISGALGLYYIGSSPDYETKNSYAVTVNAADTTVAGSTPVHQDFALAITDVNESPANQAPTAVTFTNTLPSLAENSDVTGGIRVADIAITDDAFGINTLSLGGADAALFAIRDTSGGGHALYYVGSSPDYETKNSYAVTVNAQDTTVAGSTPVHQDFALAITDVNEAPANQAPTAVTLSNTLSSLAENSSVLGGIKVADIGITDDALGINTLSLSGADAALFAIRDTSGGGHALYYVGSSPDYETKNSYAVTVNAQDATVSGSASVHQDFTLGIANVNEAPTAVTLSNTLPSLAENSSVTGGIRVADIGITDDVLGANALSLSGADAASFAIRDTSGGGHALYYVGSSPDYETKNSYGVTVNAQDVSIAGSAAVHQNFTLTITDVAEPPVAGVNLVGTAGDDTLTGGAGNDKIDGAAGNDTLYGLGGNDSLTSGPGFDRLYGGDGDDTMETKRGTGPDFFDGGNGIDLVSIDLAKVAAPLSVNLSNPAVLQNLGDGSSIINVERITIVGGTGADHFVGGALADTLNGYNGNDVLQGAGGDDTLTGGAGNDTFVFNSHSWGNDKVTDFEDNLDVFDFRGSGFAFTDLLLSQQGADVLVTTADHASSIVIQHTQLAQITTSDFLF